MNRVLRSDEQLAAIAVARMAVDSAVNKQAIASLEAERDADRQERSRMHGMMRDQAHALADAKGQLRAANERVDHLCAAIAPCQGECDDDCRQKRLCDLARRYVNPTAQCGASAEFAASLRRTGVL